MIGVPMADPRAKIAADLNRQIDQFFAAGREVREIAIGVSADAPVVGGPPHADRLRAVRDKLAPQLKKLAADGMSLSEAAKEMGIRPARAALIAKENDITLIKGA